MRKRIETIEVNDIFFNFVVGQTYTLIWTKAAGQWATLPDYCKMEFAIDTPKIHHDSHVAAAVERVIRKEMTRRKREQVKTSPSKPRKKRLTKKQIKAMTPSLFEKGETQ
jgi:hypothetical protein